MALPSVTTGAGSRTSRTAPRKTNSKASRHVASSVVSAFPEGGPPTLTSNPSSRPQRDQALIDEAGITLDRALFPLVVIVDRRGPIGVVDLAGRVGRDYTTVSRQIAKLERLGLVERRPSETDRRVREATVTPAGKAMNDAIDAARERLAAVAFASWQAEDLDHLVHLIRRFADAVMDG